METTVVESIDFGRNATLTTAQRRYDVDWVRTLALGLLILYHIVITFQPWAGYILFIQNEQSLESLWLLMGLINIWRIPILFLISGMGVRFAMQRRNWGQLLKDRTKRILLPFIFGFFFIAPINVWFGLLWHEGQGFYIPNAGHLWFLGNIFVYVLLLFPVLYWLRIRPKNPLFRTLCTIIRQPLGIFLIALPMIAEAIIINPQEYPSYANTGHGFWLGMVCFVVGYLFVSLGEDFWQAVTRHRFIALGLAFSLYLVRLFIFELDAPNWLIAFESMCWILTILGFAALYLNQPSGTLSYLSSAVYPVYIIHLPVQFALSYWLIPLSVPAIVKLLLLLIGTYGICLLLYEFVLSRVRLLRPFFGMKTT